MNMRARNRQYNQKRMRRVGTLALALMLLTLPVVAVGASSLTSGNEVQPDVEVLRARLRGQYLEAERSGEPELDVVVIRGRQGLTFEAASGELELFSLTSGNEAQPDVAVLRAQLRGQYLEAERSGEPEFDLAVIRARLGQYLEAARSGEPELDVVVIRGRQGLTFEAASGELELFSLTSGVDPMGPVHGGGYAASAESELLALTSGVDPSGPIHGSSLSCLEQAELDMLC